MLSENGEHNDAEIAAAAAVKYSEGDILSQSTLLPDEYTDKVIGLAVAYNNWWVQKELLS